MRRSNKALVEANRLAQEDLYFPPPRSEDTKENEMEVQDIDEAVQKLFYKKENELSFFGDYAEGYEQAIDDVLTFIRGE